ncbi:pentapeptide repeat-containing protein [Leptolyngbya sp. CCNP1308]|uniref:pentapeptide repeat-containing protein n=1 Tax=Leptolyngbya sp. CCNP1308 TaxID=3110255 RepID=UPI002B201409|nr:pentapeptide repeat-containing protein [Leptolyngbya sp. CCNP1308]MEA5452693.1 pentapeptide repeat-containing protein [Leptolyngbya sp. CCNP1308]
MSRKEHIEILKQGVKAWNQWRKENPKITPNLREAALCKSTLIGIDLSGANLHKADLSSANLSVANLVEADLRKVNLENTDLSEADFSEANLRFSRLISANLSNAYFILADLSFANLSHADLSHSTLGETNLHSANLRNASLFNADLSACDLSKAVLINADLSQADLTNSDLKGADLSGADLSFSQVLSADFSDANLTGACIADWHQGNSTKFQRVHCEYIFRTRMGKCFSGRLPVSPNNIFGIGEFELWANVRASALETIDLTFTEGLKWQDFFSSLQEVRSQNPDTGIFLQGVEEKDGQYVVRLRIETDKTGDNRTVLEAKIETTTKELVETRRQLHEAHGEIKALDRVLDRRDRSLEEALLMATNQGPKYDLKGAQFAGGFAETVQGNQTGGIINNYGQNTEDIIRLLTSLREQVQAFPTEHREEALDLLDDVEIDLKKPKPNINRMGRKLKRFAEIATTIGILTAGAVTFSGNLNEVVGNVIELTETLGIPIDQVQPSQISPEDTTQ